MKANLDIDSSAQGSGDFGGLMYLAQKLEQVLHELASVKEMVSSHRAEKEWYSTVELAEALGKSVFTVTQHYCNARRIECEKDPVTRKFRIPGHEFKRLVSGGELKPRQK